MEARRLREKTVRLLSRRAARIGLSRVSVGRRPCRLPRFIRVAAAPQALRRGGDGQAPFVGVGLSQGERELDARRADSHEAGGLEELEPDRAAGPSADVGKADAPDRAEENVANEATPAPEPSGRAGAPWPLCDHSPAPVSCVE